MFYSNIRNIRIYLHLAEINNYIVHTKSLFNISSEYYIITQHLFNFAALFLRSVGEYYIQIILQ